MARILSNLIINPPDENGWFGSVDLSELGTNKAWVYVYGKTTGLFTIANPGGTPGDGSDPFTINLDFTPWLCGENQDQPQPLAIIARVGPTAATGFVNNGVDSFKGIPSIIQRDAPYIRRR